MRMRWWLDFSGLHDIEDLGWGVWVLAAVGLVVGVWVECSWVFLGVCLFGDCLLLKTGGRVFGRCLACNERSKKCLRFLAEMGFEPGTRGGRPRLITISAILTVMIESLDWVLDGYMEGFGRTGVGILEGKSRTLGCADL